MGVVLLGCLFLFVAVRCWPAVDFRKPVSEPTCSDGPDRNACQCDTQCAQYGDCCRDAPSFVSEQQRLGASPFVCNSADVYMMSSCPPEWDESFTRFNCENPDTSYRDPLFDVPVTSHRTNITYRNRHCALCHDDIDSGTTDMWSVYFECDNAWMNTISEEAMKYLQYKPTTLSWVLNFTADPEVLIFQNPEKRTLLLDCKVVVQPPELPHTVMRRCDSRTVDSCPEDWADDYVRTQCEAYTAHTCLNDTVYRNQYCGVCNNNGSFSGLVCLDLNIRLTTTEWAFDFTALLNWHKLRERDMCQQDEEVYDPFTKTCRAMFVQPKYLAIENYTTANKNETLNSSLDTCPKIPLESHEYYVADNDTMIVYVPAYNTTFQPHEYRIDNHSRLFICIPDFDEDLPDPPEGFGYITVIGVSLSILFLVLHLAVFILTPKLRNLSSMNLASLSVSLLLMYSAFFIGFYVRNSDAPCVVMAVIIHYTLLASFCWMLTIAYDINRVLRHTTTRLLLTTGKHWRRFIFYCLWSWMLPAAVVGAAVAADFSTDSVSEFLRPDYGGKECYISNADALLVFAVGPLLVIMMLNAVFFLWSACLIRSTRSELSSATRTHTNYHLYARLALIMGLTWAVGLIAGFFDVLEIWYAFVVLNTLQGLFIFLAFTCTKKVWRGLCSALGLQLDRQTQGVKSAFMTGTAVTHT